MSAAVLRLESFTQPRTPEVEPASLDEVRTQAFEDGYVQGRQESIEHLASQLRALNGTLEINETQVAQLQKQMLRDLGVVLNAVVDALGSRSMHDRLCHALADELRRKADATPLRRPLLRCAPDLLPLVQKAVAASGVARVQVEGDPGMSQSAELIFDSARTVFDPDAVTRSLHALITELTEE